MTTDVLPAPVVETAPKVPVASPASDQPAANPAPDQAKPVESAEGSPTPESQPDEAAKKPRQTASERISQIYARQKESEARAVVAESELARVRGELQQVHQYLRNPEQLTYDQQQALQLRSIVKEERAAELESQVRTEHQHAQEAKAMEFRAKVDAARDRMPDFDQTIAALDHIPMSNHAADVVVSSEKAAEITYWLGKNLADAHRISRLPPHMQAAEIARIESRLSAGPSPRRHSQAPPPPTTISGASAPAAKDPANMSMDEYAKWYGTRGRA